MNGRVVEWPWWQQKIYLIQIAHAILHKIAERGKVLVWTDITNLAIQPGQYLGRITSGKRVGAQIGT